MKWKQALFDEDGTLLWEQWINGRFDGCPHVWPDELTEDSLCEQGCGLAYGEWSR